MNCFALSSQMPRNNLCTLYRVGHIPSVRRRRNIANSNRLEASLTTSYLVEGALTNGLPASKKRSSRPTSRVMPMRTVVLNVRSLSNRSPKPKRTVGTQVNSVQPLVDLQCSRKPSRPSRQISEFVGFAEPFH